MPTIIVDASLYNGPQDCLEQLTGLKWVLREDIPIQSKCGLDYWFETIVDGELLEAYVNLDQNLYTIDSDAYSFYGAD